MVFVFRNPLAPCVLITSSSNFGDINYIFISSDIFTDCKWMYIKTSVLDHNLDCLNQAPYCFLWMCNLSLCLICIPFSGCLIYYCQFSHGACTWHIRYVFMSGMRICNNIFMHSNKNRHRRMRKGVFREDYLLV